MEFSVKLQPPMAFNIIWLFIALGFIGLSVLCIVILSKYEPLRSIIEKVMPKKTPESISALKQHYLDEINILVKKQDNGEISLRDAYRALSSISRGYVHEVSGLNTLKMSLSEMKEKKLKPLATLVNDYYEPEFAPVSRSDFKKSCEKTRRLIKSWN